MANRNKRKIGMSKRQFYTNEHLKEGDTNAINHKKHKFSNFTSYGANLNTQANNNKNPTIQNSNMNSVSSRNIEHYRYGGHQQSNQQKDMNAMRGEQNYQASTYRKQVPNHRISQLGRVDQRKNIQNGDITSKIGRNQNNFVTKTQQNNLPLKGHNKTSIETLKIDEKCAVCQVPTQKCCSLCKKVFYCSGQHQQFHWFTKHKQTCEGRKEVLLEAARSNEHNQESFGQDNNSKFIFYSKQTEQIKNKQQLQRQLDYQLIEKFLLHLEQRLVMRDKILGQVTKLNQRTPLIVKESLVKQTIQLVNLSNKITNQEYKPYLQKKINERDITQFSSFRWGSGVVVTQVGINLQYMADLILLGKMYHLCEMYRQAKQIILNIGKMLEDPEKKKIFLASNDNKSSRATENSQTPNKPKSIYNSSASGVKNSTKPNFSLSKSKEQEEVNFQSKTSNSKNLLLLSIIHLSDSYNIDKTSQSAFKIYIKKIESQEGVWETIYAYFNMGVWYFEKTYYEKSTKCFSYSLDLLDTHKKSISQSGFFKGECLFNMAIGYWAMRQYSLAIDKMQQSYRIRINVIGKNSIQCSNCAFKLAVWYKQLGKLNESMQYLDECYRVRRLSENQFHEDKLEEVKLFIADFYDSSKKLIERSKNQMDKKSENYYTQILLKQQQEEQKLRAKQGLQNEYFNKGSVTSRLFRDDKEYVKFQVIISQEFFQTLDTSKIRYMPDLLNYSDRIMQKSEAIRILMESDFVLSLNEEERKKFIEENQIEKFKVIPPI